MPTVPVTIAGGSYTSSSLPLSAQQTRNFYPEAQDVQARSQYVLQPFPGLTLFNAKGGVDRGLLRHRGVLYHVAGTTLYSVTAGGVSAGLASIPGSTRCILAGFANDVLIVNEGRAWVWNGTTLTEVTDVDLETPNSVAVLNQQAIYDGDGGRFGVSDVGDASSISGLSYASAEGSPDELLRVYAFQQRLFLFGASTIEQWYNSGIGNPPFDRVDGGVIEVGLGALHSVAHNQNAMYFLGDDKEVYASQGSLPVRVTSVALSDAIRRYSVTSDAIGWCFTWSRSNYYMLTFPSEDVTWCYMEGGEWFEVGSGVSGRWVGNSHAFVYGKHIIASNANGNLYELDPEAFTWDGEPIIRKRDSAPLTGPVPGHWVEMDRFELLMETGVGNTDETDPKVMLSYSDDGGRTWSTERQKRIGKAGEYTHRVEWFALGRFKERIMRVTVSDPVQVSIHSAAADVQVGDR